jgi:predicted RecB family nuclease
VGTRYDVSAVPPLGGYPAKQCPVRAQWDVIRPCEPLPPPPALERRLARGVEFERQVVARLLADHPGACVIPGGDRADPADKIRREAATLAAMRAGVPLIVAGRLPADLAGRRSGEPDLLLAAPGPGGARYRPADIKHHRALSAAPDGLPALCSSLGQPGWQAAEPVPAMTARKRVGDLLQLAHYQRMLESAGLAAADGRQGAIIGTEGVVTWYDLDAPCWNTPSASGRRKNRSTMAVYDFEFDFRLDITAVAAMHLADPRVAPLVVPVRISECDECPWWSWCGPYLRAGSGDVSLLPGIGWRAWQVHRDHGVTDRKALAALDHRTAALVAAKVDLRPIMAAFGTRPDTTPVAGIIGAARRGQLASLQAAGISTLADARSLDPLTARYSDAPMHDLAEQIDQARAALGDCQVYRRRGVGQVVVPRGDIEVDIDLENTQDGVYLWGALVTDRTGSGSVPAGYRAFASWEPMTSATEADLFGEFWRWLSTIRDTASAGGFAFRAYCYNTAAEAGQLRRIAAGAGRQDEVAELVSSAAWIDLLAVFRAQLVTGGAVGLKNVAALAGFRWAVADPGGATALVKYDEAVEPPGHEAREWLLRYNQCDVMATLALRDWLDQAASGCPSVQDLG